MIESLCDHQQKKKRATENRCGRNSKIPELVGKPSVFTISYNSPSRAAGHTVKH